MKGGGLTELGKEGWGSMEVIKVGKNCSEEHASKKTACLFGGKMTDRRTSQLTNKLTN